MKTEIELSEICAPSLAEMETYTVAAYELIAPEYDSSAHATTRTLEALSQEAHASALGWCVFKEKAERVLEVGCGTGALSSVLAASRIHDEITISDASETMLGYARGRMARRSREQMNYTTLSALSTPIREQLGTFDLVICGLADPYFVDAAVINLRRACAPRALLIVTLPGKAWAVAERNSRLGIPTNRTRFRLTSGKAVFPFSFTYSETELSELLRRNGFEVVLSNTHSATYASSHLSAVPPPQVLCAVARAA